MCVCVFCAPSSSSASPGLPRLGPVLLGFLISTHLLCLWHLHTWPTSTPDSCSIKSPVLLSVFTALLWSFCTGPLRTLRLFLGSFWNLFFKGILDHGLHSCRFASFRCKAILSSTCQSHPALVPFPFSVPQPISPCFQAVHIIFLSHQSVSLLFIKGLLHTTPTRTLSPL